MTRIVAFVAACLLTVTAAYAGGYRYGHGTVVQSQGVFIPNGFVVTQFAVPVAVPVAPLSYVFYQGGGCAVQAPATQPSQPAPVKSNPQPEPVAEKSVQPEAVKAKTELIHKLCAKCHSKDAPQGGLVLDGSTKLDDEHFRDAMNRLLSDDPTERMPKGAVVPPEELGLLMQELTNLK